VAEIQESHVKANVPAAPEFDSLLKHEIFSYLSTAGFKGDTVTVDLLRRGPTQSGVSWPKYYVWIQLMKGNQPVVAGAARVAAIDQQRFEVTDFVTARQIKKDPRKVAQIFPAALVAAIKARAKL